jgi:Zn-dependent peptidase ImmA (M78 family)
MAREFGSSRGRSAQTRNLILDFRFVENQKGEQLARAVIEKFKTPDVFEIAEKSGVRIFYEKWFPVTIGEFNRKNKTICVNLNASLTVERIIAHELGHFFSNYLNLNKLVEEMFCNDFAKHLLEILFSPRALGQQSKI